MGTMRECQREIQLYRGQIPSPGAPTVAWREDRVRFWAAIARGATTDDAVVEAGVSSPVGYRWFRHAGGVNPCLPPTVSGRYLSFPEREDIAIWRAQKVGVREISRRLGRNPSTISREVRRNASTRTWRLEYMASKPSGTRSGELADPRRPSWPSTRGCGTMSRTGFRAWSRRPMAELWARRAGSGRAATSRIVAIAAGSKLGALSRSPSGCRSISPMIRPCASAMRPSIRPFTSRAVVRSSGSWSPAYALGERYASPAPGLDTRRGLTSVPTS